MICVQNCAGFVHFGVMLINAILFFGITVPLSHSPWGNYGNTISYLAVPLSNTMLTVIVNSGIRQKVCSI